MSNLRIVAQSGARINPKFIEAFIAIAERDEDAPINISCIDALLDLDVEAVRQENIDIQNMAVMLLISNEMLAVKWGSTFYFGDVDIMDMQDASWEQESTIVQYELEDDTKIVVELQDLKDAIDYAWDIEKDSYEPEFFPGYIGPHEWQELDKETQDKNYCELIEFAAKDYEPKRGLFPTLCRLAIAGGLERLNIL